MITEARAQEAFERLRDTVAEISEAKAELERSEILRKRSKHRLFLAAPEGSVADRNAFAESSSEVAAADDRYIEAVRAYEAMKAMREVEAIAIEVWRTGEASRRKGTW